MPKEKDPGKSAEEQKKFFREDKPCAVKIKLTNEVSGYMKPILEMIEFSAKNPYLNLKKKPDYGIYFDWIRYVDQYVNWYMVSHDKNGDLVPWKRKEMVALVQTYCVEMVDIIAELKKDKAIGSMISRYESALHGRTDGSLTTALTVNNHSRYFYLQGMAAFLAKLPNEEKYRSARIMGERFITRAISIAPRISRRDIVMATTFMYLVRKEQKLCR